jgi:hypothetical protein
MSGKLGEPASTVSMRDSLPAAHPGRASSGGPLRLLSSPDEELAEVLAVQHAEERLRRVFQAVDDIFLVL